MKKDSMENDRDREAWLGPMLRRTPLETAAPCVDAETLAAWTDGKLNAQQAAAVELHASSCSRCMATLAAIERTTPPAVAAAEDRSRAIAPLWRWIVPLTAAATAVAIWIAVPERPLTEAPATVQQERERPQQELQGPSTPPPAPSPVPEQGAPSAAPAPSAPIPEANAVPPASSVERLEERSAPQTMRDDAQPREADKRERAAVDAFSPPPPAPAAPGTAPPPPPAPAAQPEPAPLATERRAMIPPAAAAAGAAAEAIDRSTSTALSARQLSAPTEPVVTNMATSDSDPPATWRVLDWMSVERSIDGGRTWIKTTLPPGVSPDVSPRSYVVSIRAVDNLRAVVLTTDRKEFYTVDGGVTWEAVQENSAAPF